MKSINEVIKSVLKEYLIEQQEVDIYPKPIATRECLGNDKQVGLAYDDLGFQLNSLLNNTDRFFSSTYEKDYIDRITKMYNNTKILYNATVKDPYNKDNNQCYPALHVLAFDYEFNINKSYGMKSLLVKKLTDLINALKTDPKYTKRYVIPGIFISKLQEISQMFIDKIK